MTPNKDEACYLLGDVFTQIFAPLTSITNTYEYIEEAIKFSSNHIATSKAEKFQKLYSKLMEDAVILGYGLPELAGNDFQNSLSNQIKSEFPNVLRRIASATMVFAHAVFEDCIQRCLKISFCAAPDDWLPEVKERKITIEDTQNKSLSDLYEQKIQSRLQDLERESVLLKLETLFRIIRPPNNHPKIPSYVYDLEKIRQIDEARHIAAHKNPLSYEPSNLEDDVQYLQTTVLYILSLLIDKYKIENKPRPNNITS
jgi:hypothetical protein